MCASLFDYKTTFLEERLEPDEYQYMDEELIKELEISVGAYL